MPSYWLMKSEPDVYSIDDLKRDGATAWSGVRNYQARNYMRDQMKRGDLVLFYHSSVTPPCVAGVATVSRAAYPDSSACDAKSSYFDPKASIENPIWVNVDVAFKVKFKNAVTLDRLRTEPQLRDLLVLKKGMRLSVQPVDEKHFRLIEQMGGA